MQLAFDTGQTQFRARVRHAGSVLFEGVTDGFRWDTGLKRQIFRIVEYVRAQMSDDRLEVVAGGSTGLYGRAPALPDLGDHLTAAAGVRHLYLADDAVTAHLGALGGSSGVLAAAGTGLVALAVGSAAPVRVYDAGPLLGNNGGAGSAAKASSRRSVHGTDAPADSPSCLRGRSDASAQPRASRAGSPNPRHCSRLWRPLRERLPPPPARTPPSLGRSGATRQATS